MFGCSKSRSCRHRWRLDPSSSRVTLKGLTGGLSQADLSLHLRLTVIRTEGKRREIRNMEASEEATMLFVYLCSKQIFIENWLCYTHCCRNWGQSSQKSRVETWVKAVTELGRGRGWKLWKEWRCVEPGVYVILIHQTHFFTGKNKTKQNTNVRTIKESSEPTRRPQNRQLKTTLTKGNCGLPDWALDHKKDRSKKKNWWNLNI